MNERSLRLRIALWLTAHQEQARRGVLGLLGVMLLISGMGIGFGIWSAARAAYAVTATGSIVDAEVVRQAQALFVTRPQQLNVGGVISLSTQDTHTEYIARIDNPNSDWSATSVSYRLRAGDEVIDGVLALLPGATRYALARGEAGSATLEITGVTWRRMDTLVPFIADDFRVSDIQVDTQVGQRQTRLPLTRVIATIEHSALHAYWELPFAIVVESPTGQIIAAKTVVVRDVPAQSSFIVEATWVGALNARTARVVPQFDPFDLSLRKPLSDSPGEPK